MSHRPKWWLDFLRIIWPLTTISAKMTQWPVFGPVLAFLVKPIFTGKNFHVSYVPINATVDGTVSSVIPEKLLEELIRRSAHRVTINRCTCRESEKCEHFPVEDACLHLGEGTMNIDRHLATPRTVDEAIAHTRKMIGMGLVPMIGRVRMDDFFYGEPNTGKMLTICYCCSCCCTIMKSMRYFPNDVKKSLVLLKGLRVVVDNEACTRCGVCVAECFAGALAMGDGGIAWNESLCKGCGRCVTVCPVKAVSIVVDDMDRAIDDMKGRIRERVDIE
jgi:UDP-glucose 4-epimerase